MSATPAGLVDMKVHANTLRGLLRYSARKDSIQINSNLLIHFNYYIVGRAHCFLGLYIYVVLRDLSDRGCIVIHLLSPRGL